MREFLECCGVDFNNRQSSESDNISDDFNPNMIGEFMAAGKAVDIYRVANKLFDDAYIL